jgi:bacterioferritin-associated ferredoxin
MIVCLCRGVSDRVVRLSVVQGARTVDDVGDMCGAGHGCGSCHETIADIVAKEPGSACADCHAPELQLASAAAR